MKPKVIYNSSLSTREMWSTEIPCRVWQLELKKAYAYVVGRYDRITITVTAQPEKQEDKMDS